MSDFKPIDGYFMRLRESMYYLDEAMKLFLLVVGLALFSAAKADVEGLWITIDDKTGKEKSVVELYTDNGKLYGKVIDLLLKPDDSLCKECKGELKNQPVVGMVILSDMQKEGDEYRGGEILDPENGKFYRCKLWIEGETLQVRGYLGPFFRTQQWKRKQDSQ